MDDSGSLRSPRLACQGRKGRVDDSGSLRSLSLFSALLGSYTTG